MWDKLNKASFLTNDEKRQAAGYGNHGKEGAAAGAVGTTAAVGSGSGSAGEATVGLKFSPDQPRVPAGNPDGGQWVSVGGLIRRFLSLLARLGLLNDLSAEEQAHIAATMASLSAEDRAQLFAELGSARQLQPDALENHMEDLISALLLGTAGEVAAAVRTAIQGLRSSRAADNGDGGRSEIAEQWTLSSSKTKTKWDNQLRDRDWTAEQITDTIKNGEEFSAPNKVHPENTATRYHMPGTNRFVVVDDVTKEVLQVSEDSADFIHNQSIQGSKMENQETAKVFVELLEEGTPTLRGTQAIPLGNDLYKLLPTDRYNPESETWQFLPGSIVRAKEKINFGKNILLAYELVSAPASEG